VWSRWLLAGTSPARWRSAAAPASTCLPRGFPATGRYEQNPCLRVRFEALPRPSPGRLAKQDAGGGYVDMMGPVRSREPQRGELRSPGARRREGLQANRARERRRWGEIDGPGRRSAQLSTTAAGRWQSRLTPAQRPQGLTDVALCGHPVLRAHAPSYMTPVPVSLRARAPAGPEGTRPRAARWLPRPRHPFPLAHAARAPDTARPCPGPPYWR
jgi:hypothetical protein